MSDKLKTKEIQWVGNQAKVGKFYIAHYNSYTRLNKSLQYFTVFSLGGTRRIFDTEPEARQWVEDQFHKFIKEVSA